MSRRDGKRPPSIWYAAGLACTLVSLSLALANDQGRVLPWWLYVLLLATGAVLLTVEAVRLLAYRRPE